MKFEEVLPALREGKKIRLKEWKEIQYIYMPKNETELRAEDGHFVNLSWKNFFSDDWEIVEEKKKIKLRDLTKEQFKKWYEENKNQKVEIEIELLTKEEKEYLEGVIKPFKDKVEHIMKYYIDDDEPTEYIYIDIKNDFPVCLPCFEPNKYYKGLERTKRYILKELGLFEEKKYKITLTEFWNSKERLAIHCDTEEKANKFIKESNKTNKRGDFGNYYEDYKEKTCYSNDSDYYDLNSYKEDNYTIYEFDEVDLEN